MGALMRAKNWSETPMGEPESWPQSLRTTLSIILSSKFPMFLWWGPELICFYNDAYRPSLGQNGKHPHILGMPAKEAWPEIWTIIKPLIDQVLNGGEATWAEDQLIPIYRNGKLEDVYWTFSYSPVSDESGIVAGVLVTCSETTDKVTLLRTSKEREEQLNFTIDAADLGIWDLSPATNRFVANHRLKEWFGLEPQDEIELPVALNSIAEEDRNRVAEAIKNVLKPENGGTYYEEYSIENPVTKRKRRVLAKGKALFNAQGQPYKFSGTLQDITQRYNALKKFEESEKRFRNTVVQAPLGITILRGPKHIPEMANSTYLQLVDKTEEEFVGKPLFESLPEVESVVAPLLHGVLTTGIDFHASELSVILNRYGRKELAYFNLVYHAYRDEDGTIGGIIVVATEVTASVRARHKLAESEKQFRNLVMQSPIPMTIFRGPDYVIEMANKVMFEKIWRKSESEVIGKKLLEVFPELNDQKYPELLHQVYTTGKVHSEKESLAMVQGNDGLQRFYLDFEYNPFIDIQGDITGIIVTVNDVSEKVEARQKIEESENRFRKIADNAPVLIWMAGTDKLSYFFNTAWLTFTGRTTQQEIGNGWMENIHPDDLQRCLTVYNNAFDKHEEFYMEFRLKRHDGEYRWISDNGVPRFTGNGEFEGYIGACMDIHGQVEYQKSLKASEEKLNIVVEASELGIWEFNPVTDGIIYDNRYLEIFGHKEGNIKHEIFLGQIHPDDIPVREKAFETAYATGVFGYKFRILWPDKTLHWVEAKGKVFFNDEHQAIKMIGTVRDITDEKMRQQELQESEQKFRLLADSMPQHIWTSDTEGNLNYYNQSVYNYTGLTPAQIEKDGWLQIVHAEDQPENIRVWTEAISTGNDFLFEHRFRRHDGQFRWQLSRAIPQKDSEGHIQMWVGTSTDIQEQKTFTSELEKQVHQRTVELQQKNKELEKMNTELQSFAYVSSHDLQEPLRKIQTFAARLLDKEEANLSDQGKDYFKRMQNAARRMQILIDDLLSYSRTNTTERTYETTDLNELLAQVKNDLHEDITTKEAIVESQPLPTLKIIPFQFKQLLHNLIGNSIKFSREIPPHIKITCAQVPAADVPAEEAIPNTHYYHFSISDNGIGFDDQYKLRIFEVFQRLHGKDEYKGTGIGLAIVKKIVENHHGFITATGVSGVGATFDIYIPAE